MAWQSLWAKHQLGQFLRSLYIRVLMTCDNIIKLLTWQTLVKLRTKHIEGYVCLIDCCGGQFVSNFEFLNFQNGYLCVELLITLRLCHMSVMASKITSNLTVWSRACSTWHQGKHNCWNSVWYNTLLSNGVPSQRASSGESISMSCENFWFVPLQVAQ